MEKGKERGTYSLPFPLRSLPGLGVALPRSPSRQLTGNAAVAVRRPKLFEQGDRFLQTARSLYGNVGHVDRRLEPRVRRSGRRLDTRYRIIFVARAAAWCSGVSPESSRG